MRIQCPPCGARYSVAAKRVGPDGRALSKCAACGTWLVIHRRETGLVEVHAADDVGDKRAHVALDPSAWAEAFQERATLPIAMPLEEADSVRPTERNVPLVGAAVVGGVELSFDAPGAREDTDPELGIRPLIGHGEVGFDAPEAAEGTDPNAAPMFEQARGPAAGADAGLSVPAAPAEVPAAAAPAPAPPADKTGEDSGAVEELPATAFFPTAAPVDQPPEIPDLGPARDLGAFDFNLPDPSARRRSRTEVQAMLTEFSVMFRLDTHSRRRRTLWTALGVAVVCAVAVAAVALHGGRNLPNLADDMREQLADLVPAHALKVQWRPAPPPSGTAPTPEQARPHIISILAQQLVQLNRSRARGATRAPAAPAARPPPSPPGAAPTAAPAAPTAAPAAPASPTPLGK